MATVRCEGWWEQFGLGRQPMEDLTISFDDGRLTGTGWDVVGQFTLTGSVQQDRVIIVKRYIGQHSVEYLGTYDGEGTMSGMWRIWGFGGSWLIRFVKHIDSSMAFATEDVPELVPDAQK
jgi:hypothetical protein